MSSTQSVSYHLKYSLATVWPNTGISIESSTTMRTFAVALIVVAAVSCAVAEHSAVEVLGDIYRNCASAPSVSACAKPKALSWLSNVANEDVIQITQDLKLVRTKEEQFNGERNFASKEEKIAERIMSFLDSHSLKMEVPQMFQTQEARSFLPEGQDFGNGIEIPLVSGPAEEGEYLNNFSEELSMNVQKCSQVAASSRRSSSHSWLD